MHSRTYVCVRVCTCLYIFVETCTHELIKNSVGARYAKVVSISKRR